MPNKIKLTIVFIVLVVLTTVGALMYSANLTKEINIQEKIENSQDEQVSVSDLVITETKETKKYWEIYAENADYKNEKGMVELKEINGNFYKDDKVVMSVYSPSGIYVEEAKKIVLMGRAAAVSDSDFSIESDMIIWNEDSDMIVADGNVVIQNKDIRATSEKAMFNKDLTLIEISGKTSAKVFKKVS